MSLLAFFGFGKSGVLFRKAVVLVDAVTKWWGAQLLYNPSFARGAPPTWRRCNVGRMRLRCFRGFRPKQQTATYPAIGWQVLQLQMTDPGMGVCDWANQSPRDAQMTAAGEHLVPFLLPAKEAQVPQASAKKSAKAPQANRRYGM